MKQELNFESTLKYENSLQIPMTYHHFNQGPDKPLLVFLHGYIDSGTSVLKRAFPDLDDQFEILAPNAPFPHPIQKKEEWRAAFCWYFADFSKRRVLISPKVSVQALTQLLAQLDLVDRPKVIIGFSQGGFLIPYLLPQLKNVKRLIGIGAAYRKEDYSDSRIHLDAIHGVQDETVTYSRSQESFNNLKEINPNGTYYSIPGLAHTMNDEARSLLKKLVKISFSGKQGSV